MDPLIEKVLSLGLGGVAIVVMFLINRDILARFAVEMKAERDRNDANLVRFFDAVDKLAASIDAGKCKAE